MDIASVMEKINNLLDTGKVPHNSLAADFLNCISMERPGLSAIRMASEAIQNNQKLGIPTGPNPDGSENLINAFVYNIYKTGVDRYKEDNFVDVAIPTESLLVEVEGANAGGGFTAIGTNKISSTARGIGG